MPGFSSDEQRMLAALVGAHRRRVTPAAFAAMPPFVQRLLVLLRLAVVFNRSRRPRPFTPGEVSIDGDRIVLRFAPDSLERHPLTVEDLRAEARALRPLDLKIKVEEQGPRDEPRLRRRNGAKASG
jgi:exopolyphosphatase/guanosine-5'-triphosphate,3'-diphosphate pyrophosphatase